MELDKEYEKLVNESYQVSNYQKYKTKFLELIWYNMDYCPNGSTDEEINHNINRTNKIIFSSLIGITFAAALAVRFYDPY